MWSDLDQFFAGWVPGFFRRGRMRSRSKDLYVELVLDRGEAAAGGLYPLRIPVRGACLVCGGTGYHRNLWCGECETAT